jgi:hypothetical protein
LLHCSYWCSFIACCSTAASLAAAAQAIRGGGGLYGIVTAWKFKLFKAPEKVHRLHCSCIEFALLFHSFCTKRTRENAATACQK